MLTPAPGNPESGPSSTAVQPQAVTPRLVERDWLHRFALVVRQVTLSTLEATNSCIFTTRVACEALARLGVSGRAMPVYVTVYNREAWELSERRVPVEAWPQAAHSVGISEANRLSGWNGHLVVIVRQPNRPRLMMDLTADQFDRPIRNLVVGGPVFMDIPPDKTWTPRDPLYTIVRDVETREPQTILSYRPMPPKHPEASRWRTTPGWNPSPDMVEQYLTHIVTEMER